MAWTVGDVEKQCSKSVELRKGWDAEGNQLEVKIWKTEANTVSTRTLSPKTRVLLRKNYDMGHHAPPQ
jgi:hypothetical protein